MSDSATRQYALRSSSSTRPRSGSEAIRRRVAQLMQTTASGSIDRPTASDRERNLSRGLPFSHRNLLREGRHKTSGKDKPLPITPGQPRALKKKKSSSGLVGSSERPENRVSSAANVPGPSTSKPTSRQTSARVFDALAHPPILDHDLSISSSQNHQSGRATSKRSIQDNITHAGEDRQDRHRHDGFKGSLAAAEFDRMRKEIETLKEALQDSRKTSKRNQKVIPLLVDVIMLLLTTFLYSET